MKNNTQQKEFNFDDISITVLNKTRKQMKRYFK